MAALGEQAADELLPRLEGFARLLLLRPDLETAGRYARRCEDLAAHLRAVVEDGPGVGLDAVLLSAAEAAAVDLQGVVDAHRELLRGGNARAWRNYTYNEALRFGAALLSRAGIAYAAGEAALCLWHAGARALTDVDALDPDQARAEVAGERGALGALDIDARKRLRDHEERRARTAARPKVWVALPG